MVFYERIIDNKEKLNKFLNSIGFEFDPDRHKVIRSKEGAYIMCSQVQEPFEFALPPQLAQMFALTAAMCDNNDFDMNAAVIFLNDIGCSCSVLMNEEKENKTEEWLDFLTNEFGFAFVNQYNKKVEAHQKREKQKKENIQDI